MAETGKIRVLLVDHEQTLLEFLARRLQREGFTVSVAFSGEEALQTAIQTPYDVAVVNTKLCGMDGVKTQNMLREIQPDLRCIVITQMDCASDALPWEAEKCSCRLLYKPVDFHALAATIQELNEQGVQERDKQAEEPADEPPHSGIRTFFRKLQRLYGLPV